VCFTDGVTEACDRKDEMVGEEGLQLMIKKLLSSSDGDLLERIFLTVKETCGHIALEDDVTLLSVERLR
jgi:serine phosphatase RsbU (regulator of sigma subunit)